MKWHRFLSILLITLGVFLLSLLIRYNVPAVEDLELKTVDWRFQWRGIQPVGDSPIVLVTIDDQSFEVLPERWPWPRSYYARAVQNLTRAGAAVIGIDVILDVPDRQGPERDSLLAQAIRASGKVVLARKLDQHRRLQTYRYLVEPLPLLQEAANDRMGLVSIEADGDGIYRRYPVIQEHNGDYLSSFALELLREYHNYSGDLSPRPGDKGFIFGEYQIPTYEGSTFLINFAGPPGTFREYSFASVIDDEGLDLGEEHDLNYFSEVLLPERVFQDKIVIIGSTVSELHDNFPTPFLEYHNLPQEMPGAEILASATRTLFSEEYFTSPPDWVYWSLVAILTGLVALGCFLLPPSAAVAVTLGLILLYTFGQFHLFTRERLVMEMMFPPLTLFLTFVGINVYNYILEQKEKRRIMGAFQHYVPVKVVQELLKHPEKLSLGGEERVMTVLFSDVANFTTISESLTPKELVTLINEYLSEMTDIILKYDGIIDKYEGDAIMAEFGAPIYYEEHALNACYAALEMQRRLKQLSREWRRTGRPVLSARAGINTGNMIVGNMGSKKVFDYTVLGDEVNLASRLEGANKPFRTRVMISEATCRQVKEAVITRPLDSIVVKGKSKPVKVFELIARRDEKLPQLLETILPLYLNGIRRYEEMDWHKAEEFFLQCIRLMPDDGPSQLYLRRARDFAANPPPPDWDGVYELKTK